MKIAIVGSRKYKYLDKVNSVVKAVVSFNPLIISGEALGVDLRAHSQALIHNLNYIGFPVEKEGLPEYPHGKDEFRRRAYERNTKIAQEADFVVAFWDGKSGGTKDTMDKAEAMKKPVFVIYELDRPKLINSQNCTLSIMNAILGAVQHS